MATTYVALLRGINVGGKNKILMSDLTAAFESAGYGHVRTYIQSGNVIFEADTAGRPGLEEAIGTMLAATFHYPGTVAVRDLAQMEAVVEQAPEGFGDEPDRFRYDLMFLLPPLEADDALAALAPKDGVDAAWAGPGVVYFSRLSERAASSGLSRIVSHPVYQRMTIRNWTTTTRLLAMMRAG